MLPLLNGLDETEPAATSLTITVPAFVPSERQGSLPWTPSSAKNRSVPPTFWSR